MIYLIVAFILLLLCLRYDLFERTKGRKECYLIVLVALILIAGLRWRVGGDTTRYLYSFYYDTPLLKDLTADDLQIGNKPLWRILLSFVYTIGGKFFWVQIIESAFVNILIFKYIKKHCQYIFTCVFFYYISLYILFNTEVMKAAFGIVVCLFANDYMLDRKWLKAYLLIVIGVLFHPQVIVFAFTPLFLSLRINKISILLLLLSYFVGYAIQISVGDYLDLLESMGDDAVGDKLASYGSNPSYIEERTLKWQIINSFPIIIYSIVCVYLLKNRLSDKLLRLQPFFIMGLAYQIMSLKVYVFYRIADSYKIYILIFLAYTIVTITKDSRLLHKQVALFRTFLLFSPLVLSLLFNTMVRNRVKYYPYTSVFKREIIRKRELHVHNEPMIEYSCANKNQY